MHILFAPAIALVAKLRFAQKFVLIALILAIPSFYMLGRIISNFNENIEFIEREGAGLQVAITVRSVIDLSQQHRGLTSSYLQGKTDFAAAIEQNEEKLRNQLSSTDALFTQSSNQTLQKQWQAISPQVAQLASSWKSATPTANFASHTKTIDLLLGFMEAISHESGLALDSEVDSYYLQAIFFNDLLPVGETVAKARGLGARLASAGSATAAEQLQMGTLAAMIGITPSNIEKKIAHTSNLGAIENAKKLNQALAAQQNYLQQSFANDTVTVDPAAHFAQLSQTITQINQLSDQILGDVGRSLELRATEIRQNRLIALGISGAMLLLGSYLLTGAFLSIIQSVKQLRQGAERFAQGDLSQLVQLNVSDELADVSESFNSMASGLKNIIAQIRSNAGAVSTSAAQLNRNTESVVQASRTQANASGEMAAAMEEMSVSIASVSEHAGSSEEQARSAQNEVDQGQKIMQAVLGEITELASDLETLGGNVDSMKKHSVEIGKIVQVIKEIAEQTNLLALNAAIEAARAGEQGRGFAVVADEVRKLSERTSSSTGEIHQLVATIQKDTEAAAIGMDRARKEMDRGSQRVGEANDALAHIRDSSHAELNAVAEISSAMSEQKAASHLVAQSVERIARMAEDISHSADQNASLSSQLQDSAAQLERLVSQFKLS
ncbi:methyl-accepting chemotaxis protein [Chitinibacter sp. GC72]|uniref:methyl-accepting chemotaxis protein n=1 Tax=Chitinibacter sp. GC72 TaxID=1526917 RepID=UPI0012FA7AA2|nr:methyl-accepting chemotaxis protein [Chitinibacter sp. GC72]